MATTLAFQKELEAQVVVEQTSHLQLEQSQLVSVRPPPVLSCLACVWLEDVRWALLYGKRRELPTVLRFSKCRRHSR